MKTVHIDEVNFKNLKRFGIKTGMKNTDVIRFIFMLIDDDYYPDIVSKKSQIKYCKTVELVGEDHLRLRLFANEWGMSVKDSLDYIISNFLPNEVMK